MVASSSPASPAVASSSGYSCGWMPQRQKYQSWTSPSTSPAAAGDVDTSPAESLLVTSGGSSCSRSLLSTRPTSFNTVEPTGDLALLLILFFLCPCRVLHLIVGHGGTVVVVAPALE
jgi:hypothetical protein